MTVAPQPEQFGRRRDVALGHRRGAAEPLPDGRANRADGDLGREGGEAPEQRGIGQRPADLALRHLGRGHRQQALGPEPGRQGLQPELVEGPGRVDEHIAVRAEPGEEVDLVDQSRIDHDQAVRRHHWFTRPYLALVETAVRDHRSAHALGPEARERLRVPALLERREGQEVGGGHGSLPTPTVEAHCEHGSSVPRPSTGGIGTKVPGCRPVRGDLSPFDSDRLVQRC